MGFEAEAGSSAREAAVRAKAGPMAETMLQGDFFGSLERRHRPLSFQGVAGSGTFVVERKEEPRYLPMLTVQVTLTFGPPRGVSLFEADEGGALVCAGEVCQVVRVGASRGGAVVPEPRRDGSR